MTPLASKETQLIGYVKESDYIVISQNVKENIGEVAEISQEKLPHAQKLAFTFHHTFYPKPRVKLEDVVISDATRGKTAGIETKL